MKTIEFSSCFAESMNRFVAFKRAANIAFVQGAKQLATFDRFAAQTGIEQPVITQTIVQQYRQFIAHTNQKVRYDRIGVLRQFSAFHHLYYPHSHVILELGIRKQQTVRFTILEQNDVAELIKTTHTLPSLRRCAAAIRVIIGIMYTCGLRIGETLALNISDFDPQSATLHIRCGKFRKQRYIPMAVSTRDAVNHYLTSRKLPSSVSADKPLFADEDDQPISYDCAYRAFNKLLDATGLRQKYGPVRLHDLRHSFASTVLRRVVSSAGDVYAMLPKLAVFMGHVSYSGSQIYLHADPGCFAIAAERFHDRFYNPNQT